MKLQKILFPTDFSPYSEAALQMASSLARDTGATLLIIHVEASPAASDSSDFLYKVPENAAEEGLKKLSTVVPPDPEVVREYMYFSGDPVEIIIRTADVEQCDLIVMGHHSRHGISRWLMGSIAEAVVRRASRPVLTIKHLPTAT